MRLYSNVNQSKKLLPNKHLFKLHGFLLVSYLLVYVVCQILMYIYSHTDGNIGQVLHGVYDLLNCFTLPTEVITFFLVVKLMLPITKSEKRTQSGYVQFVYKGFVDLTTLKAAIYANNPDMTAD